MKNTKTSAFTGLCFILMMITVTLFANPAAADATRKALPVDQAYKDPSFLRFRTRLLDAIARRDVEFVVSQASLDIHLSFGGHSGRDDFRKFLTLSEKDMAEEYKHQATKQREDYWDALETVLRLGGRFASKNEFHAPYTWTVPLKPDDDVFATRFVVGTSVALRQRPSLYGRVLARLSHDIVTVLEGGDGTRFTKIKLASGKTGFVHEDFLRSAVDYRAHFVRHDGTWAMTVFLAGD